MRDKDVAATLREGYIGFMGSDVYSELQYGIQDSLMTRIALRTDVRFALAAPRDNYEEIRRRFNQCLPIKVATSYPRWLRSYMQGSGSRFTILSSPGGSVEVMPMLNPNVEAVVDIVRSGKTLSANGLRIVQDNLQSVELLAVWLKAKNLQYNANSYKLEA